jgi:endonuclease/exonuclease/phosphatase family metal-dependent hydrolase
MKAMIGAVAAPEFHVMTFNVRRRMPALPWSSADRWSHRRPAIGELLRIEQPSLIGVQEALPDQASMIASCLGDHYRRIGHGRRPGPRGEGCPAFFDEHRFELLDAEQTALSDRPHHAGSRSWGALLPRVLVRVTLQDRVTGAVFTAMNTHLDPFSRRSRVLSATLIRSEVEASGHPVIVMGDLNADPRSCAVNELLRDGLLRDAWLAAGTRLTPEWRTYGGYRDPRVAVAGRGRIDGIFVTPAVRVRRAAISTQRPGGRWPSDHFPVHAVLELSAGAAGS